MSTSNQSQVAVVSEFSAEGELSVVVDLSSDSGVLVKLSNGTELESELISLIRSVRSLEDVVIASSSISSSQDELAEFNLSLVS